MWSNANDKSDCGPKNWEKWMPKNLFAAEKVFGAIAERTCSPIAQYISSPTTFCTMWTPESRCFLHIYSPDLQKYLQPRSPDIPVDDCERILRGL